MISLLLAAATVVATISPQHRLVEGVATDGRTIWASSVLDRGILACRRGTCRTLAVLPPGLHPLGIAWDASRERLWVAADCPELPGIEKCNRGELVALDARGRIRARLVPSAPTFHPGDISSTAGEVFVGDSQSGVTYSLTPAGDLRKAGSGKSAQGSALDRSGGKLVVADYSEGVTSFDLATGEKTILKRDDGRPIRGIDGLLRCGSDYYAIYNGQAPGEMIRFTVEGERIRYQTVISGGPLVDPTQLATDGKRLLIVANAGWEGASKGAPRARGAPILAVPLAAPCPQ